MFISIIEFLLNVASRSNNFQSIGRKCNYTNTLLIMQNALLTCIIKTVCNHKCFPRRRFLIYKLKAFSSNILSKYYFDNVKVEIVNRFRGYLVCYCVSLYCKQWYNENDFYMNIRNSLSRSGRFSTYMCRYKFLISVLLKTQQLFVFFV